LEFINRIKIRKITICYNGFAKESKKNIIKGSSIFDHCKLTNIKVILNSVIYPYDNLNIDFTKINYAVLYNMYISFQESYYGKEGKSILSPVDFETQVQIVVIDTFNKNIQVQLRLLTLV
jgi:hypothetical protein